jgi:hypothetical protein
LAAATLALAGGRAAAYTSTSSDGVVFVHGTSDHTGTQSCTGTGMSWSCVMANAVSYWKQGEIDSVRTDPNGNKRPYAIIGFHGGTAAPWTNSAPVKCDYNCSNGTEAGTGDEVATQIDAFLKGPDGVYGTSDDINKIVVLTHSGGGNVMRYIIEQYAGTTPRSHVYSRTQKVIVIANPSKGTYLANKVFSGGNFISSANSVLEFFGGSGAFNNDGTNFIRTDNMTSYNADSAKLVNLNDPVNGITFRQTGGISGHKCFGATVFGVCIGITGPTLGGSSCDSGVMDTGLVTLHDLYLNSNDAATARNSCSDGFISCASSQALGAGSSTYQFSFSMKQDHNQSRRQCNNEDVNLRNEVNSTNSSAFEEDTFQATDVPPSQWDACGFGLWATVYKPKPCGTGLPACPSGMTCTNGACYETCTGTGQSNCPSSNYTCLSYGGVNQCLYKIGYTEGCQHSDLGDGYCDWDCVALYGHDAAATFDAQGRVTSWGANDDCALSTETTTNTYTSSATCTVDTDCSPDANGILASCVSGKCTFNYTDSSNNPWTDGEQYTSNGSTYTYTTFTGTTYQNSSTAWFTDPNAGTTSAAGYCPQSWIGDGKCDECIVALYGADGNDCLPGRITQCGGIITKNCPYGSCASGKGGRTGSGGNPIYNERDPSTNASFYWATMPAVAGNGVCENTECTPNKSSPCASNADCLVGGCNTTTGYCNVSDSVCAANTDCQSGTCVNGGCTTQGTDCSATTAAGVTISLCR